MPDFGVEMEKPDPIAYCTPYILLRVLGDLFFCYLCD